MEIVLIQQMDKAYITGLITGAFVTLAMLWLYNVMLNEAVSEEENEEENGSLNMMGTPMPIFDWQKALNGECPGLAAKGKKRA